MSPEKHNGWDEWCRHVLSELTRLNDCVVAIQAEIVSIRTSVEVQKVKSGLSAGMLGILGGAIPAAVAVVILFLKK
jgi:hypothetical protein